MVISGKDINMGASRQIIYNFVLDQIKHKLIKKTSRLLDYIVRIPKINHSANKWVLITGCDSGFGRGIAERLDAAGLNVFAGCYTTEGESELKEICSSRCITLRLDISDSASVRKAFDTVKKNLPPNTGLWGLFNNAGIQGKMGPPEWLTLKDYQDVLDVNLLGLIDTTMVFLPLIKMARGRIINTSSMVARLSDAIITPYCISKYGIESFSDSMRRHLHQYGVTVHVIQPGGHCTNLAKNSYALHNTQFTWDHCPVEAKEEYGPTYVVKLIEALVGLDNNTFICSNNVYQVVDAYEHAVLSRYPRARYMVGHSARFGAWPISLLPEWLADWTLRTVNPFAKIRPQCLIDA